MSPSMMDLLIASAREVNRKSRRRRGSFGPVRPAAPKRVLTTREVQARKDSTRAKRARRDREAALAASSSS